METENARTEKFIIDQKNTSEKLPEYIQKCIDNLIKNEAFSKYKVLSRQLPVDGGNYLAELFDITIQGKTKSGEKELNIFVKNVVQAGESLTSFMPLADVYRNESFFYKEVAKTIQRLEEDAGVPIAHRFKCVKGYNESTSEVILMENVAKKGFRTHDRMKLIPLKFFELSMQQLARWHGASFVMRERAPEFFHEKIEKLKYLMKFNEHWTNFANNLAELTNKSLSDNVKEKANKLRPELQENFRAYMHDAGNLSVLCHGDFRANNILIREEEGEIKEVLPIDYQIIYYGNPANDILYFIYGCNDLAFRQQHGNYLINLYYKTMEDYLRYFDIDIEKVYPRKSLDESLKEREDWGALLATHFYPFFYGPDDDVLNISDIEASDFRFNGEIVKRIEEAIEERGKGMTYLFS